MLQYLSIKLIFGNTPVYVKYEVMPCLRISDRKDALNSEPLNIQKQNENVKKLSKNLYTL